MKKPILIIAGLLILLIAIKVGISLANPGNDQTMVEEALAESIQASKEGRPGGVLDKISGNLKVNDMDANGNRSQIADFIKKNHPDLTVENKKAVISGDQAEIVSPVTIELSLLGQSRSINIPEVTMIFKKESDMEYLIIPTKKWKLAEVRLPDDSLSQFMP